jgi:hypothetical protein
MASAASTGAGLTPPLAAEPLPPGFDVQPLLIENWSKPLNKTVDVAANLKKDAPELSEQAGRERHRIYSYLLMKLIHRFWNGNKRGPLGTYPLRAAQKDVAQKPQRYRGDMIPNPGACASIGIAILDTTLPASRSTAMAKPSAPMGVK